MPTTALAVIEPDKVALDRRAEKIRGLMANMVKNTIAIGAELAKAYESFPIGPKGQRMGWKTWLKEQCNIKQNWAGTLIRTNQKFGHLLGNAERVPSASVLEFLARDSVTDAARTEVIIRHRKGEKISKKKAKAIARKHLPGPKAANKQARETGKPVEASDGYVYLGATDEQMYKAAQRRTVVYGAREAIETLSAIQLTATEFLEFALPHQLWRKDNQQQIEQAYGWLGDLRKEWEKRGGADK